MRFTLWRLRVAVLRLRAAWRLLWNVQIIDRDLTMKTGEWYVIPSPDGYIHHRCCRCGLIHLVQLAVVEVLNGGPPMPRVAWQWTKEEIDQMRQAQAEL